MLACLSVGGYGASIDVTLTVGDKVLTDSSTPVGIAYGAFTFDAPTVTATDDVMGVPSGGYSVTLLGTNFGHADLTATITVGPTECSTTSWSSLTVMACQGSAGVGDALPFNVLIVDAIGTLAGQFTYSGPVASFYNLHNGPTSGGASVSVMGDSFGFGFDSTPTVTLGGTEATSQRDCLTSAWTSNTLVICGVCLDMCTNVCVDMYADMLQTCGTHLRNLVEICSKNLLACLQT